MAEKYVTTRRLVRALRLAQGLTQAQVAERAGVDYKYYQRFEAGQTPDPSLKWMRPWRTFSVFRQGHCWATTRESSYRGPDYSWLYSMRREKRADHPKKHRMCYSSLEDIIQGSDSITMLMFNRRMRENRKWNAKMDCPPTLRRRASTSRRERLPRSGAA